MTPSEKSHVFNLRASVALVALACACMAAAQAQITELELKQVVVSASRSEQFTRDLPLTVDVLNARDLELGAIGDIRDAAQALPNVSVKRAPARFGVTGRGNAVGADANAGFSIRGQGGNRVVMLVDGVRLPRSYINGSNAFGRDSVAVGVLKRIEVVHGPASVLYGSDGMAGLVNFITLDPADFLADKEGTGSAIGGQAWAGYSGDDQGVTVGATVAARATDTLEWSLTSTQTRSNGLSNMGTNEAANNERTAPNPQSLNNRALLGKIVFRPTPAQRHSLTLEHVRKTSDVDLFSSRVKTPVPLPANYAAVSATNKTLANAAAVAAEVSSKAMDRNRATWIGQFQTISPLADRVQVLLTTQNSTALDDGSTRLLTTFANDGLRVRTTNYDERALQGGVQVDKLWTVSPVWSQKLTYGVDLVHTDISSLADGRDPAPLPAFSARRYFPDTRDQAQALYAQSEWISDAWRITPGLRYQRFDLGIQSQDGYFPGIAAAPAKALSGSAWTPKLGALLNINPQWSVYGSFAAGFRAPEGQQVNSALEVSTAVLLPNPDLRQEESRNLELGARARFERLTLDFAAFTSAYKDLIVEKKDLGTANGLPASTTNKTRFQTINVDKATIVGFEVRGNFDWGTVGGGRLSTPFAYGMTRGTNDSTGLPLNTIDPAKLTLGLQYRAARWDVRLEAVRQEEKKLQDLDSAYVPRSTTQLQFLSPASTTLNLSTQWRLHKGVRLNLAVDNLTDQKTWNWSDVQGLASNANPMVVDAYTQPGRHLNASLVVDF